VGREIFLVQISIVQNHTQKSLLFILSAHMFYLILDYIDMFKEKRFCYMVGKHSHTFTRPDIFYDGGTDSKK
jgi:hypothetical protein